MRIPEDAVIAPDKLTKYLLALRLHGDKSQFLARAGFHPWNPEGLTVALRALARSVDAVENGYNEYGSFLRQEGLLVGPNGERSPVVLIWLRWHLDGTVHFVTLKPWKERH